MEDICPFSLGALPDVRLDGQQWTRTPADAASGGGEAGSFEFGARRTLFFVVDNRLNVLNCEEGARI